MEEKKNPLKNIQIQVRPSPPVLKIMLVVVILLSMAALGTLRLVHNGIQTEIEELKAEAAALEYANSKLDLQIEDPESLQNIKDFAQEELGLVNPDTIVIDVQ